MSKKLVACFSAGGNTARLAKTLAEALGADLFEIRPAVPYTSADLNWRDDRSRSTVEMRDPASRPAIAEPCPDLTEYDTVYVGFPVWWHTAPTIINTFLESGCFAGKTVVPFATSGGGGLDKTAAERLAASCPGASLLEGRVFPANASKDDLSAWVS